MLRILEPCPAGLVLLFVLDRSYARVSLMRELLTTPGVLFLMRAPKNVVVRYRRGQKDVRAALGSIRVRHKEMIPLSRVLYRGTNSVKVDIVIYWEKTFRAPWYLVLPPGSDDVLPTEKVVELYRSRM